jgi:hypothetical protein
MRPSSCTYAVISSFLVACAAAAPPPPASAITGAPLPVAAPHPADVTESAEPIRLTPLFGLEAPDSSFPPKTTGDLACLGEESDTGDHVKDFASLVGACGAPTGMREYVKAVSGELHYGSDERDTFLVRLRRGFCYRFFAVGDRAMGDLDCRVTRAGGALVAADATASPTAVVSSDEPWCGADDGDYLIDLVVGPPGFGGYTFGVWARPKS